MKFKIILLFFYSAFLTLPSTKATDVPPDLRKDAEGRRHVRMPIRISAYNESWETFWSVQTCGICDKLADDCGWLASQKEDIRLKWIRTRNGS